jgi:hypothetical protein
MWRELQNWFQRGFLWLKNPAIDPATGSVPTKFTYYDRTSFAAITLFLPVAAPTDTQVDGWMRANIFAITECMSDFGGLRIETGTPVQ